MLWKNAIIPKLTQKPLAVESQSQLKAIFSRKLITATVNCNRKPIAHKNQLLPQAARSQKPIAHESYSLPKADCSRKLFVAKSRLLPQANCYRRQSLFNEITSLSTQRKSLFTHSYSLSAESQLIQNNNNTCRHAIALYFDFSIIVSRVTYRKFNLERQYNPWFLRRCNTSNISNTARIFRTLLQRRVLQMPRGWMPSIVDTAHAFWYCMRFTYAPFCVTVVLQVLSFSLLYYF